MKPSPIVDRTLWDAMGNSCRIELHQIDRELFELYVHSFNSDVPRRFMGSLGEMISYGENWINHRKAQGFQEQLQSFNPDAVRV